MSVVLHYDQTGNQFHFPCTGASSNLSGSPFFTLRRHGGAYEYTFSGRYPVSLIGTRAFKALYPHGRATQSALAKINEIKAVEDQIASEVQLRKFEHLFRATPYQHQRKSIEYMMHYERLALLLEQGLGKTFISIMAVAGYRHLGIPHRTLVVCPNIVFAGWLAEVAKFSDLKVLPYKGDPKERREQRKAICQNDWDMVLTTFDQLTDHSVGRKTSANGLSMDVLREFWAGLSRESRSKYAEKWFNSELVSMEDYAVLLTPQKTVAGKNACVKILTKIPLASMPMMHVLDAKAEASNSEFFKQLEFDNLIIDEASRCISHESKRSQILDFMALDLKRVYLLSGTLCVGRPTDMYMPMHILDPNIIGGSWYSFLKTYCYISKHNKHVITGYRNVDKLKTLIAPHILAMERKDCIDLPDRIMTRRYYELPANMKKLYNSIVNEKSLKVDGHTIHTNHPLVKISKTLQVLSGFLYSDPEENPCDACDQLLDCVQEGITPSNPKCPNRVQGFRSRVIELEDNPKLTLLEEDLADTEGKVIIWAWYRHDIKSIEKLLRKKKIPYITADTEGCAAKFETDPDLRVFLGQTVQGIGITLNSASTTIYYSHGTALEPRLQSMDRNYRIGQKNSVVVKDYLCSGTIEESIVSLLSHKEDVKDFLQKSITCFGCQQCAHCQDNGVKYLRKGCVHEKDRETAEKKKTLKLWEI